MTFSLPLPSCFAYKVLIDRPSYLKFVSLRWKCCTLHSCLIQKNLRKAGSTKQWIKGQFQHICVECQKKTRQLQSGVESKAFQMIFSAPGILQNLRKGRSYRALDHDFEKQERRFYVQCKFHDKTKSNIQLVGKHSAIKTAIIADWKQRT